MVTQKKVLLAAIATTLAGFAAPSFADDVYIDVAPPHRKVETVSTAPGYVGAGRLRLAETAGADELPAPRHGEKKGYRYEPDPLGGTRNNSGRTRRAAGTRTPTMTWHAGSPRSPAEQSAQAIIARHGMEKASADPAPFSLRFHGMRRTAMTDRTIKNLHPAHRDDIGDLTTRRPLPRPAVEQVDQVSLPQSSRPADVRAQLNRGLPFRRTRIAASRRSRSSSSDSARGLRRPRERDPRRRRAVDDGGLGPRARGDLLAGIQAQRRPARGSAQL